MSNLDEMLQAIAARGNRVDADAIENGVLTRIAAQGRRAARLSGIASTAVVAVALMIGVANGRRAAVAHIQAISLDAPFEFAPSSRLGAPA